MRLLFKAEYRYNLRVMMQKCGYTELRGRDEESYVRVLSRGGYPRFHCYVEVLETGFRINLHLDQKRPSYGEHTAHSGEYDGAVVEREAERLQGMMQSLTR